MTSAPEPSAKYTLAILSAKRVGRMNIHPHDEPDIPSCTNQAIANPFRQAPEDSAQPAGEIRLTGGSRVASIDRITGV